MSYRFTSTSKWDDPWFISLKRDAKTFFNYICDKCDCAGFLEISIKKIKDDLELSDEEVKALFKETRKSYLLSIDRHLIYVKNFLKHQKNLPLKLDNKSHQGVLKRFELYKERFSIDLIEFVHSQNHVKFKGLTSPIGKGEGIGDGILKFEDYTRKVPFKTFWDIYGKKVGNKENVEKKWNHIQFDIQNEIISILPKWKMQFKEIEYMPYPETFLNQQRWKDEISVNAKNDKQSNLNW